MDGAIGIAINAFSVLIPAGIAGAGFYIASKKESRKERERSIRTEEQFHARLKGLEAGQDSTQERLSGLPCAKHGEQIVRVLERMEMHMKKNGD